MNPNMNCTCSSSKFAAEIMKGSAGIVLGSNNVNYCDAVYGA
jgi:hypothetical protein